MDYARAMFIISDKQDAIVKEIYKRTTRGITILDGFSPYTKEKRPVIMCVITKKQTALFKSMVQDIDPKAFVIVTDVFEVLGEGFRRRV
jgi:uncharacterized membrane-anchored protein YitT (DUF2179 family)